MKRNGRMADKIVTRVADREDVGETALPQLYDSIEVDALEELFEHTDPSSGTELRVEFSYAGYTVVLREPEKVSLEA